MPIKIISSQTRQQGATLIVCLIILAVITIMGVGSIQNITLEEKMAGNMKDRNTAFQAAESGLRVAEGYLGSATLLEFDGSTKGLYEQFDETVTSLEHWSEARWTASGASYSNLSTDPVQNVDSLPRYVIEQLDAVVEETEVEAGQPKNTQRYYRVTTRAVGASPSTQVILQSIYKR